MSLSRAAIPVFIFRYVARCVFYRQSVAVIYWFKYSFPGVCFVNNPYLSTTQAAKLLKQFCCYGKYVLQHITNVNFKMVPKI